MKFLKCPICGYESSTFNDYAGEYYILGELKDHFAKNAICPNCSSDMRHRFAYKFLTTQTDFCTRPLKLIHYAPEKWLAMKIRDMGNIDYVPVDINPAKFDYMDVWQADITDLPFEDETFDALIMFRVLDRVFDDAKAIQEMQRVLRNDAWAMITVPTIGEKTHDDPSLSPDERERMYGIDQRHRLYGTDLADKLESPRLITNMFEFSDVGCDFADLEHPSPHIDSDKYIFYCKKKIPKLSVITVTYNAGAVLEKTLQSLFSQAFDDFELIIIDANSTDDTIEIIRQYSDEIEYWISEADDGIYDAMNKGLAAAKGEYVQFLNAGDYYSDKRVLLDIFSDPNNRPTLIYGDINVVTITGHENYQQAGDFSLDALLARGTGVLCHQAMFIRRTKAPLYNCDYTYKAELNWYFDILETDSFTAQHVERPVVFYTLGGFGYQNFIRNRLEWVRIILHRFGLATVFKSRIIAFLFKNSLSRYPMLNHTVAFIKRIGSIFKLKLTAMLRKPTS